MPLDIQYKVAELRNDSLWLYPDVYRLARGRFAAQALTAMAAAGYDTATVDRARLSAVIREAGRRPAARALTELLLPPAAVRQRPELHQRPGVGHPRA